MLDVCLEKGGFFNCQQHIRFPSLRKDKGDRKTLNDKLDADLWRWTETRKSGAKSGEAWQRISGDSFKRAERRRGTKNVRGKKAKKTLKSPNLLIYIQYTSKDMIVTQSHTMWYWTNTQNTLYVVRKWPKTRETKYPLLNNTQRHMQQALCVLTASGHITFSSKNWLFICCLIYSTSWQVSF